MLLLTLFWEYCKVGLFAVGGGMATLPFLYNLSDKYGWFTYAQLADMIAVSESTPGPIGVNMATYAGFTLHGVSGAVVATLGLALPSLTVICIIAGFLKAFRTNKYVNAAFYALRPASAGLIASAGLGVVMICLVHVDAFRLSGSVADLLDWRAILLAAALFVCTNYVKPLKKLHPVAFIGIAALVGVVFRLGGA